MALPTFLSTDGRSSLGDAFSIPFQWCAEEDRVGVCLAEIGSGTFLPRFKHPSIVRQAGAPLHGEGLVFALLDGANNYRAYLFRMQMAWCGRGVPYTILHGSGAPQASTENSKEAIALRASSAQGALAPPALLPATAAIAQASTEAGCSLPSRTAVAVGLAPPSPLSLQRLDKVPAASFDALCGSPSHTGTVTAADAKRAGGP